MENYYYMYDKSYNFFLFKITSMYKSMKEVCHTVSDCGMLQPRYQVIAKNSDVCQTMENITVMYGNPSNSQIFSGISARAERAQIWFHRPHLQIFFLPVYSFPPYLTKICLIQLLFFSFLWHGENYPNSQKLCNIPIKILGLGKT